LLMRDIHSRRFRIRYTYLCQRLLPTRSLQRICFREKKKRVSISNRFHQKAARGEDAKSVFDFEPHAPFIEPPVFAQPVAKKQ
jgi:hypothetical protein